MGRARVERVGDAGTDPQALCLAGEQESLALADAAQANCCLASAAPLQLERGVQRQPCTGSADGVAQCYGTAVEVGLVKPRV